MVRAWRWWMNDGDKTPFLKSGGTMKVWGWLGWWWKIQCSNAYNIFNELNKWQAKPSIYDYIMFNLKHDAAASGSHSSMQMKCLPLAVLPISVYATQTILLSFFARLLFLFQVLFCHLLFLLCDENLFELLCARKFFFFCCSGYILKSFLCCQLALCLSPPPSFSASQFFFSNGSPPLLMCGVAF